MLDDERTLAQSNGIMIYLADGSDLIPDDRFLRGKMMEWLFWEQYSHEPYVAVARFQMRYLGKAIEDVESRVIERGAAALLLLDRALTGKIFLGSGKVCRSPILRWSPTPVSRMKAVSILATIRPYGAGLRGWSRRSISHEPDCLQPDRASRRLAH